MLCSGRIEAVVYLPPFSGRRRHHEQALIEQPGHEARASIHAGLEENDLEITSHRAIAQRLFCAPMLETRGDVLVWQPFGYQRTDLHLPG